MKYKLLLLGLLSIFLIPSNVFALDDVTVSLACPDNVNINQEIECVLSANVNNGVLGGIQASYNFNDSFDYVSFTASSSFPSSTGSATSMVASNFNGLTGNVEVGKIKLRVKSTVISGSNIIFGFSLFKVTNTDTYVTSNIPSKTMHVLNTENTLSTLSLDGIDLTPEFSSGVNNYSAVVSGNKGSITISSELTSNTSSYVDGFGNRSVSLNYGENRLEVRVRSESGVVRTYTIIVTRTDNRSTNNNLSALSVTGGDINFNANTLNYNLIVENTVTSTLITATKDDNKATVNGGGKVNLNVGNNTFRINVVAENGATKTYTINITRKNSKGGTEVLSIDNTLKSLVVDEIPFTFNKDEINYNVSVKYDISKVTIKYEVNDSKATATLKGNSDLVVGNNLFEILVTSEEGNIKTYSIVITRKDERVDVDYDKDIILSSLLEYKKIYVEIPNSTTNKVVDLEILDYLKKHGKTICYEIVNADKGLIYSVTIDGTKLKNISKNLDLSIDFNKQKQEYVLGSIKNKSVMYLNFANDGELPGEISIKLYAKEYFKEEDKIYLYYNNTDKLALELVSDGISLSDGFININVSHTSSYLLVNGLINNSISRETILLIIIVLETIVIIGGVLFIIIKKFHKRTEEVI